MSMKLIFHTLKVLTTLAIFVVAGQGLHSAHAGPDGAYFGVIPDESAQSDTGVPLRDVKADSPAAEAGLQAGDVIVKFGETPIRGVDDLLVAVRTQQPEQAVRVVYLRQGQIHEADVTLKAFW